MRARPARVPHARDDPPQAGLERAFSAVKIHVKGILLCIKMALHTDFAYSFTEIT